MVNKTEKSNDFNENYKKVSNAMAWDGLKARTKIMKTDETKGASFATKTMKITISIKIAKNR